MRPNDWTDECGQGHDKPTHVLHMCSPIRLVLPLRTHVALVLNSWAAQFLVLVTDNIRSSARNRQCRESGPFARCSSGGRSEDARVAGPVLSIPIGSRLSLPHLNNSTSRAKVVEIERCGLAAAFTGDQRLAHRIQPASRSRLRSNVFTPSCSP